MATYTKEKWKQDHAHFDFLQNPPADLIEGLEPAKDQQQLPSILDAVGTKILEMTQNFPNTTSLEAIHQQRLSKKGESAQLTESKIPVLVHAAGPGLGARLQGIPRRFRRAKRRSLRG